MISLSIKKKASMISHSSRECCSIEQEKYQVIHLIKHHYPTPVDGCAANTSYKVIYAIMPFTSKQIQNIHNIK
jgi:hypothetical protein